MQTRPSRVLNFVSAEELHRRWAAARAVMLKRGFDALVVQNSSDWVGGYIRWFSNQTATNGYPSSVVFPLEGGMSFIEQGPIGGSKHFALSTARFVERILVAPPPTPATGRTHCQQLRWAAGP